MSNTIQLKRSTTTTSVPVLGDVAEGELALNLTDGLIFSRDGVPGVFRFGVIKRGASNNQTSRFNGTDWVGDSTILNDGTDVTIANDLTVSGNAGVTGSVTAASVASGVLSAAAMDIDATAGAMTLDATSSINITAATTMTLEATTSTLITSDTDKRVNFNNTSTVLYQPADGGTDIEAITIAPTYTFLNDDFGDWAFAVRSTSVRTYFPFQNGAGVVNSAAPNSPVWATQAHPSGYYIKRPYENYAAATFGGTSSTFYIIGVSGTELPALKLSGSDGSAGPSTGENQHTMYNPTFGTAQQKWAASNTSINYAGAAVNALDVSTSTITVKNISNDRTMIFVDDTGTSVRGAGSVIFKNDDHLSISGLIETAAGTGNAPASLAANDIYKDVNGYLRIK